MTYLIHGYKEPYFCFLFFPRTIFSPNDLFYQVLTKKSCGVIFENFTKMFIFVFYPFRVGKVGWRSKSVPITNRGKL